MTVWNLNRLRYAIRKITGKYDTTQIPDTSVGEPSLTNPPGIDDYINDFYLYDFPECLRSLRLKDFYTFTTIPNCGTYALPQTIYQLEPPIYVDNYQFAWYQSPDIFYRIWPELDFIDQNLFSPDGVEKSFTFNLTQTPVQQGTVTIGLLPNQATAPFPAAYPQLETFTDKDVPVPLDLPFQQQFVNPGTLYGNLGGTGKIDYITGEVTITYASAPPIGLTSSCHYHPYVASRPRDIMFYQQQLFVRPIPNDVYTVKLLAYQMPTVALAQATNAVDQPQIDPDGSWTGTQPFGPTNPAVGNIVGFGGNQGPGTALPQYNEWWQVIAYGAALKIFIEDGEHEEYERYLGYFQQQKLLAQRKELKQLANQRINTAYSENQGGAPSWPIFPLY